MGPFLALAGLVVLSLVGWLRSSKANRWLRAEVAIMRRSGLAEPDLGDVAIAAAVMDCEGRPG